MIGTDIIILLNTLKKNANGPSINYVIREEVQKMAIWGNFQGLTGVKRGGRGAKKLENLGDLILDGP